MARSRISDKLRGKIVSLYLKNHLTPVEIHRQLDLPYTTVYAITKVAGGYSSVSAYRAELAKRKGFESLHNYRKFLDDTKTILPSNVKLKDVINRRLKKLDKSASWLAEQVGLSKQSISIYRRGRKFPNEENWEKIRNVLGIKEKIKRTDLEALIG